MNCLTKFCVVCFLLGECKRLVYWGRTLSCSRKMSSELNEGASLVRRPVPGLLIRNCKLFRKNTRRPIPGVRLEDQVEKSKWSPYRDSNVSVLSVWAYRLFYSTTVTAFQTLLSWLWNWKTRSEDWNNADCDERHHWQTWLYNILSLSWIRPSKF